MAKEWSGKDLCQDYTNKRISGGSQPEYVPLDNVPPEKAFDFVYLTDDDTIKYLNEHGRIAFVIRGPPGTRKELLKKLLLETYKKSVTCSADDYFSLPFASERSKASLKTSHDWCEERLAEYCNQNAPCIILKNSHIRKWELDPYLNILRKNYYTVILCETTRKFKVNAKILEHSNTKGLKRNYFSRRLKQWDEIVPWFTGWFLNPSDTEWIFKKSEEILSTFSKNEEFKKVDFHSEEIKFYQEPVVFCIAAYCCAGQTDEGRALYLNAEIQEQYGKMFELCISFLVIYKKMLIAAVQYTDQQYRLTVSQKKTDFPPRKKDDLDLLRESMNQMSVRDQLDEVDDHAAHVQAATSQKTFKTTEKSSASPANKYGFMLLGREKKEDKSPLFSQMTDCENLTNILNRFNDGTGVEAKTRIEEVTAYKVENATVLELNDYYVCQSVFTGLY